MQAAQDLAQTFKAGVVAEQAKYQELERTEQAKIAEQKRVEQAAEAARRAAALEKDTAYTRALQQHLLGYPDHSDGLRGHYKLCCINRFFSKMVC